VLDVGNGTSNGSQKGDPGMAIAPEARVLRDKESWNLLYVALGFAVSIEGTVIGMMGLTFPNNILLYALAGGITVYLFMFNGQAQDKLIGWKERHENTPR
jgi:hypothetical protein